MLAVIRNLTVGNCLIFGLTCLFVSFTFEDKPSENQAINRESETSFPMREAIKSEPMTLSQEIFNQARARHFLSKTLVQKYFLFIVDDCCWTRVTIVLIEEIICLSLYTRELS